MIRLGVNIDHVATIRNARGGIAIRKGGIRNTPSFFQRRSTGPNISRTWPLCAATAGEMWKCICITIPTRRRV